MNTKLSNGLLGCLFALLMLPTDVVAQVTQQQRDRRRQFVGDLLKTLIESQQNRDPVPTQPGRPNLRPFPGNDHKPGKPLTPNMISARTKIKGWEQESDRFIDLLRRQEQTIPRVRPLLADALTTSASIKALRINMERVHTLDPLTDSFCQIDAQWRLLNHKVSQLNGLNSACATSLTRMAKFDTELCALFDVQPQLNRRELARHCTLMASGFQHLIQDLRYDMARDPQYKRVVSDCQRLYARLSESGRLIERGNYDSIVSIYKQSVGDWRKLKYKLASSPHGRIHQDIHRIDEIGGHIAELLWLPVDIDRRYLGLVIESMNRDVTSAFKQVSLQDILDCKSPGLVLSSARSFQNHCGTFSNRLKSDADVESLLWDYKQFSNQWSDLNAHLTGFSSPSMTQAVSQVDEGFAVLQTVFGDGPLIDRATMIEICAELDQLSYRLQDLALQRTRNGYDPEFRTEFCDHSRSFHSSIHEMHEHALSNRRHDASASADVTTALAAWTRLRPMINQCKPADRKNFQQLRAKIEPMMVKLQVIFTSAN